MGDAWTEIARDGWPTLRCAIHARLFVWNPLFAGHGDALEYEHWYREFGCTVPAVAFRPQVEI